MQPLPRSFYVRPALQVARDLLGKHLVRKFGKNLLVGKIVEVEAYCPGDPASHAYRGRTKRNDVMFWDGGHLYVYFTYGMHFCANVVTERQGKGEAVLVRAVEPLVGIQFMLRNRFPRQTLFERNTCFNLTNGPAKFCQAFQISKAENGTDLTGSKIFIAEAEPIPSTQIVRTSRIGIRAGKDLLWRYYLRNNDWVSHR